MRKDAYERALRLDYYKEIFVEIYNPLELINEFIEERDSIANSVIKTNLDAAAKTLPVGYGYEFSGMTREEQGSSSGTTAIIFMLCLVFVYLLLSAQYESYILPLSVILSIPFGLAGSFIFALMMGVENNIYLQIALIMLIGLLAKNAILIVEFALDRRRTLQGKREKDLYRGDR